jgi:hypothetical protein
MSDTVALPRHLIAEMFPNNARAVAAFEALIQQITQTSFDGAETSDTASALQNATFVTLSANDVLANERVLQVGPGLTPGDTSSVDRPSSTRRQQEPSPSLALVQADAGDQCRQRHSHRAVERDDGRWAKLSPMVAAYANDAAAAAGGVPVHGFYRNGNAVMVRLA